MMMMMMIMTIITRHQLALASSSDHALGPSFASVASKVMRRGRSPGSHRVQSGPPSEVTTPATFDRSSIELFRRRREGIRALASKALLIRASAQFTSRSGNGSYRHYLPNGNSRRAHPQWNSMIEENYSGSAVSFHRNLPALLLLHPTAIARPIVVCRRRGEPRWISKS